MAMIGRCCLGISCILDWLFVVKISVSGVDKFGLVLCLSFGFLHPSIRCFDVSLPCQI
jgi:hypothetical protein